MTEKYWDVAFTPEVLAAQSETYERSYALGGTPDDDTLGPREQTFIAARDSFYMATVSSTGWPYLQHRGGDIGFLRMVDAQHLVFADVSGNRQLVSTGNVRGDGRVALFLMDYPGRKRLKIMGRATVRPHTDPQSLELFGSALPQKTERFYWIKVIAFDWNCPKFITPRFAESEVRQHTAQLKERIATLEAQLDAQRGGPPGS